MKYYEVIFNISCESPLMQDARDILSALAGETGFETFEETAEGLRGYVQQELFDQSALDAVIEEFPFGRDTVSYKVQEAEDKDWNEEWESAGFEPIVIRQGQESRTLVIHDGRHLPTLSAEDSIAIEIDAKLAFGTGTHETTQMVCATLMQQSLDGKRILDCGCGTGILGIAALKLGAAWAVGYDIDSWSVDNTRHNAVINQVDDRMNVLLGDSSVLDEVKGTFHVVVANINRNILLNDLPQFRRMMAVDSTLILSGFYTKDVPLLVSRAEELGLSLTDQQENNSWACISLRPSSPPHAA